METLSQRGRSGKDTPSSETARSNGAAGAVLPRPDMSAIDQQAHAGLDSAVAEKPSLVNRLKTRLSLSKRAKTQIKLLLSVIMIGSLFFCGKFDLSKCLHVASQANPWLLGLAAVMLVLTTFLNAHRWQILAAAVGFHKPVMELAKYCFAGNFFNLMLPSTVGGDFSRSYYLSKGTGRYHHALYSVLADRVVGISVLFAFATGGILFGPGAMNMPWQLKAPILGGTVALFGLLPFLPTLTTKILGPQNKITQRLNNSVVQAYWRDSGMIGVSLVLSVVLQLVMVLCHVCIGLALGFQNVPLWYYFVFYPSVAVLGFITPSFNGVGIREWAYTYFLTMMGVDQTRAVTFAVIWLGLITFNALFGGVVYALGHLQINKEEAEKLQYDTID
ncbi:MAG TPA: lysylphosphatidylglycerol synthase transmembrane domain-containing protein [Trichormus sp.]